MMKKKKHSRSQSSSKKTIEPSPDSSPSPSPRLLSIFRSKLVSGKDLKHMFRGMKTKTAPGLSSQSRIVRCPKCHKLLQEPIDATIYKCSGCNSILQAKRWDLESNGDSIPEALLYSQNRSLSTQLESAEAGSKTPMRSTHREYKHETSDVHREWMRRADEFSVTGDSDAFASARSSPYNSRSNASEWTQHERRYQVPFYPASPSPSSAYEYGYNSPFHGSQASASEKSYYHQHQPNQFKQKEREGWFQESSASASPIRFPGETSNKNYYPSSSQYHNLYEPRSSVYSERSYQAPLRSTYSEHSKSGTSREKRSQRDKKKDVRKKKPVVKRYVLPSAGGAPFATCSYCLELLQLPQVSLHGKHKGYQVRCGSCSGVLNFSVREKADTGFAEETVSNHQDSASEGHDVESFEDNESKEDTRSMSSTLLDSKLEALQPSLNQKVREQQPESSESIGETSRKHLEQYEEACSEKSTEMDDNISERVSCDVEEVGLYEKNETLEPEVMFGDGSGESLEVPVYKKERMSDSSIEAETVADTHVPHIGEPNEHVCETRILSENTGVTQGFDWEETQENEECGGEGKWEDITGDKPGLVLEKSQCIADSICDSSSSNGEIYEDTAVKEDTNHILASPQNENKRFIGLPDQSGEATVVTSRTHGEKFKYEHENLSERQELVKTISDRVKYELQETRYETSEALDTDKVSEDGSAVSLTKASDTFSTSIEGERDEERSVSHQMDLPNENVEDSYERLEYACERTWAETMEARAGLHLEEYESNYENYSRPFELTSEGSSALHMHEYEQGMINEPEEDADGRLESSSKGSFSDHEIAEESPEFQESQDAKSDYEMPTERQELSNTVFDTVTPSEPNIGVTGEERSVYHHMASEDENLEFSYGTVEQVYLEGSGYASERTWAEAKDDGAGLQLEECHNNPHEWTSERAPTFRLHESELGTMSASEEDAYGRSSSSTDSTNDHEAVAHEKPSLMDENKFEELRVSLMVEDGPSLHLEKYGNDSTKLEDTVEWTSERAPTFRLHDSELGTMLEPEEHPDRGSESSSTGSFNNHVSSKLRTDFHEEEEEELQLHEMTEDRVALDLKKGENGSIQLEETFEWTSERAPTFRLHDSELVTRLEPDEDADGRSESSSRGTFNDHVISKEREMYHEEEPRLVIHSRTKVEQVDQVEKDTVLNETFKWTSERVLTFTHREYELGTMLEPDEDASESSLRGSFNDHGVSKERAVSHKDEPWLVEDYETKALKASVMADNEPPLHLEKCENEKVVLNQTLEPRDDLFKLSHDDTLEQERIAFHLEKSQDKQVNLRQTFKQQGDTEHNIPASEGHESPSKMAEVDSEAEEDMLGHHLEHLQIENERSGLTSEPYSHFFNTTDPSEIVGLRLALYETQTSPLSSPMHTPMGSPLHILMRSPIASPMRTHIVSPMRSPINSSGSLSDVLFFGKKA